MIISMISNVYWFLLSRRLTQTKQTNTDTKQGSTVWVLGSVLTVFFAFRFGWVCRIVFLRFVRLFVLCVAGALGYVGAFRFDWLRRASFSRFAAMPLSSLFGRRRVFFPLPFFPLAFFPSDSLFCVSPARWVFLASPVSFVFLSWLFCCFAGCLGLACFFLCLCQVWGWGFFILFDALPFALCLGLSCFLCLCGLFVWSAAGVLLFFVVAPIGLSLIFLCLLPFGLSLLFFFLTYKQTCSMILVLLRALWFVLGW